MPIDVELTAVEKAAGGRVHLTAASGAEGAVRTLCGITFAPGRCRVSTRDADCQTCRRRRDDETFLSGALFESGRGEALLEMSLAQAGRGRPRLRVLEGSPGDEGRRRDRPRRQQEAAPPTPAIAGELETAGFRRLGPNTYVTRDGISVELDSAGRLAKLRSDHPVEATRDGNRVRVRTGSAVIEIEAGTVRVAGGRPHEAG